MPEENPPLATGSMEETANGWIFTKVNVEVSITLEDPKQAAAMRAVVEQAAKICPISNSLNSPVQVDLHLK